MSLPILDPRTERPSLRGEASAHGPGRGAIRRRFRRRSIRSVRLRRIRAPAPPSGAGLSRLPEGKVCCARYRHRACGAVAQGALQGQAVLHLLEQAELLVAHACERADRRRSSAVRGHRCIGDRKSTRLNSSHLVNSYAVFCLKKKKKKRQENINENKKKKIAKKLK